MELINGYLNNFGQLMAHINKKCTNKSKTFSSFKSPNKKSCLNFAIKSGLTKKYSVFFKPFNIEMLKISYAELVKLFERNGIPIKLYWECVKSRFSWHFNDSKIDEAFLSDLDKQMEILYNIWGDYSFYGSSKSIYLIELLSCTIWLSELNRKTSNAYHLGTQHKIVMENILNNIVNN